MSWPAGKRRAHVTSRPGVGTNESPGLDSERRDIVIPPRRPLMIGLLRMLGSAGGDARSRAGSHASHEYVATFVFDYRAT
jgi:hypothetical protein